MADVPEDDLVQAQQPPKKFTPPAKGEAINVDGHYYFVGEELGKGAFGVVYECTDEWSNELVAKILIPRNKSYEEIRENWASELTKLRELRHPNITYIHAAFEYKDTFYLILERCSFTLDVLINYKDLTPDRWIPWVARDILQGLEYIHANGYIHKDIHVGNVHVSQSFDRMVPSRDPVWSFKIADLGISRLETEVRAFNTLLAQWMLPPEAIDPQEFGAVSRTTDIYHVGLLLLAIANKGTPSFTSDEIIAGRPRLMAEACGSAYAEVIGRALRRHVDKRTQSAIQFWREIQGVAQQF